MKKRTLAVSRVVRDAHRLITQDFGGVQTHDSGHAKSPTWIYTFPNHGHAQLGLRVNKEKLSVYVRRTPPGRPSFDATFSTYGEIEDQYGPGRNGNPANSLLSEEIAPYLTPRRWPLVRVRVNEGMLPALLTEYLGTRSLGEAVRVSAANNGSDSEPPSAARSHRAVTPDMLRRALDRNDATGRAGERLVYAEEIARLAALGCPDPATHVSITADVDVAAGYDIRSEWNGEIRCIEVKATRGGSGDFFLTANERAVLTTLAEQAWLYRVRVDDVNDGGHGVVVQRLQNPMAQLPEAAMQPMVWRVDGTLASNCGDAQR